MALFDGLTQRVEQRAREIAEQTRHLAETVFAGFPDILLRREGDDIVISGRGLMRRWIGDVRLRFALWRSR
jgi:hypothetical protein